MDVQHQMELEGECLLEVAGERAKIIATNVKTWPQTKHNVVTKKNKNVSKKSHLGHANEGVFKKKKDRHAKESWKSR